MASGNERKRRESLDMLKEQGFSADAFCDRARCKLCVECQMTTTGVSGYCRLGEEVTAGIHTCQDFLPKSHAAVDKMIDDDSWSSLVSSGEADSIEDCLYDGEVLAWRHGPESLEHGRKIGSMDGATLADAESVDRKVLLEGGKRFGRKTFNYGTLVERIFRNSKIEVKLFGGLRRLEDIKEQIVHSAFVREPTELQVKSLAGAIIYVAGGYTADEAAKIARVSRRTVFNYAASAKEWLETFHLGVQK